MFNASKRGLMRIYFAALCALALMLAMGGCSHCPFSGVIPDYDGTEPFRTVKNPGNDAFYQADGSFDAASSKEAYFKMMRAFGYPIPKILKSDNFWVCDFLQQDFEKLGMGGIFWINASGTYKDAGAKAYKGEFKNMLYGYLGHDIYLLPGQMLPEHHHLGGPEGYAPKMESWHIRYGSVDFFGEYKGEGNETLISEMPASEQPWGYGQDWFQSKYVASRTAGDIYSLEDPESWHFQRAGPQGAIVSEYATYHNHVEFSKPGMDFEGSGPGKRVSLFNGRDLSGWELLKCEAAVVGGNIMIQSGNGLIQSKKKYSDFVLEFDWKALAADKWDSGVYFRYDSVPEGRPWPKRYQINLRKGQEGNVSSVKGAESTGLIKIGDWNKLKLTVKGSKIDLQINGQPAWSADGLAADPKSGYIALQAEVPKGGQHLFRDIFISEL